ncbi:MAG: hypothetical protein A6F71_02420 [Cycloclasticus sp. symbiont of Poecilosclerida sp. M]|nr:MAG: hypothetical protein A6F71_02420 [Cycloclasticus sp. symbiont of Poecilosclerida sp. M]
MTVLLIDRGNTRTKWQLHESNDMITRGVSANDESLESIFSGLTKQSLSGVYVASVVGESFEKELSQWAEKNNWPSPVFIRSEKQAFGVSNAYAKPTDLGVDRWLTLVAVHQSHTGLVCIVDCGTAFTIDFVNADGRHLGGFILPGINLMKSSLLNNTDNIKVAGEDEQVLLGTSTSQAVALAPAQALAAFAQKKMQQVESDTGAVAQIVLTGGESNLLEDLLGLDCHLEQDLVLKGLYLYAQKNP